MIISLLSPDLTVTIVPIYTPPPDVIDLGENEYRAASRLTLTCMVEGATGMVGYSWMTSFNNDDMQTITRVVLRPADTGNHTCTATDSGGEIGMDSIQVTVVGELP